MTTSKRRFLGRESQEESEGPVEDLFIPKPDHHLAKFQNRTREDGELCPRGHSWDECACHDDDDTSDLFDDPCPLCGRVICEHVVTPSSS